MRPRTSIAAVLLITVMGCTARQQPGIPTSGDGVEAFDAHILSFMQEHDVLGASYAVVKDGRLVLAAGYGYADLARNEAARPDHLYRTASISKPVTAVAALKASEQGVLDLDAPIYELLPPSIRRDEPADPRFKQITTRHILSHTSGIGTELLIRTREVSEAMGVENPPSPDAIAAYAMRFPLNSTPGTRYRYSNTAYLFVGRVLEHATGMPYEEYVRTQVLAPASIRRAQINGSRRDQRLAGEVEYDSRGQRSRSVFGEGEETDSAYGQLHLRGFDTSSAWVFSAVDLARFGASVDGHERVPDILSARSIRLMTTRETPPDQTRIGLGWHLGRAGQGSKRARLWDHNGAMSGTTAYIAVTEAGDVYVGLLNTRGDAGMFNAFRQSFASAIHAVERWPDRDLFPKYKPIAAR